MISYISSILMECSIDEDSYVHLGERYVVQGSCFPKDACFPAKGHLAGIFRSLWQCLLPNSILLTDRLSLPCLHCDYTCCDCSLSSSTLADSGKQGCECVHVVTLTLHITYLLKMVWMEEPRSLPPHTQAACPLSLLTSPQMGGSRLC